MARAVRLVLAATLVVVLLIALSAAAAARPPTPALAPVWEQGVESTYQVTSKWWLGTAPGSAVTHDALIDWEPPVAADNHAVRCRVAVTPHSREQWPPGGSDGAAGDAGGGGTNAWLFRAVISRCTTLRARFRGRYVAMPAANSAAVEADPRTKRMGSPFFFTRTDDGRVRRLYVFPNETVVTRNFKRGMVVSFLSVVEPAAHAARAAAGGGGEGGGEGVGGGEGGTGFEFAEVPQMMGRAPDMRYRAVVQNENGV